LSIESQIAGIKKRIEDARLAKMRAQVAQETAQKQYDAGMAKLRELFGVDNQAQARAKLAELQADLDSKMEQITLMLDKHKL
jgi:formate-dependent nitrite reductase cytochrome c552 subunit